MRKTEEEIARLKKLSRKTHDERLRQRYDIIRLYLCKRTKPDIAAILDISLTQVYLILKLYKEGGVEGLVLKRPTGRQRKLTKKQETELRSIITEKLSKEVGLEPHCNWTAP
ncbi:MAG: helix-turn-helix domain-containing protein [Oscillospiraceae bacterium]|nr:helix-turn-helix domain-containing protein [Oscillospiraceae bacterium]